MNKKPKNGKIKKRKREKTNDLKSSEENFNKEFDERIKELSKILNSDFTTKETVPNRTIEDLEFDEFDSTDLSNENNVLLHKLNSAVNNLDGKVNLLKTYQTQFLKRNKNQNLKPKPKEEKEVVVNKEEKKEKWKKNLDDLSTKIEKNFSEIYDRVEEYGQESLFQKNKRMKNSFSFEKKKFGEEEFRENQFKKNIISYPESIDFERIKLKDNYLDDGDEFNPQNFLKLNKVFQQNNTEHKIEEKHSLDIKPDLQDSQSIDSILKNQIKLEEKEIEPKKNEKVNETQMIEEKLNLDLDIKIDIPEKKQTKINLNLFDLHQLHKDIQEEKNKQEMEKKKQERMKRVEERIQIEEDIESSEEIEEPSLEEIQIFEDEMETILKEDNNNVMKLLCSPSRLLNFKSKKKSTKKISTDIEPTRISRNSKEMMEELDYSPKKINHYTDFENEKILSDIKNELSLTKNEKYTELKKEIEGNKSKNEENRLNFEEFTKISIKNQKLLIAEVQKKNKNMEEMIEDQENSEIEDEINEIDKIENEQPINPEIPQQQDIDLPNEEERTFVEESIRLTPEQLQKKLFNTLKLFEDTQENRIQLEQIEKHQQVSRQQQENIALSRIIKNRENSEYSINRQMQYLQSTFLENERGRMDQVNLDSKIKEEEKKDNDSNTLKKREEKLTELNQEKNEKPINLHIENKEEVEKIKEEKDNAPEIEENSNEIKEEQNLESEEKKKNEEDYNLIKRLEERLTTQELLLKKKLEEFELEKEELKNQLNHQKNETERIRISALEEKYELTRKLEEFKNKKE